MLQAPVVSQGSTAIPEWNLLAVQAPDLWSLLGIHARPKTEAYKTVSPSAPASKAKPKRPRVYAYVNPFHNIDLKRK